MQTLTKQVNADFSLMREYLELRNRQKLETARRIIEVCNLKTPSGLEVRLNGRDRSNDAKKPAPGKIAGPSNELCFYPPFDFAWNGPSGIAEEFIQRVGNVHNPFCQVDRLTGEMSLSMISGQHFNEFYGAGDPDAALFIAPVYEQHTCGSIDQVIAITPSDQDNLANITVEVEIPEGHNPPAELVPGIPDTFLQGLTGVQGIVNLFVAASGGEQFNGSTSFTFLDGWATANSPARIALDRSFPVNLSFTIPAGTNRINVYVLVQLFTYMENSLASSTTPNLSEYALIDFRAARFENNTPIFDTGNGEDRQAGGAIMIRNICARIGPGFSAVPGVGTL